MKQHLRHRTGRPDYYKLATWDGGNNCWRDGKRQYETLAEARADAVAPGRYRPSFVPDIGPRCDLEEFTR